MEAAAAPAGDVAERAPTAVEAARDITRRSGELDLPVYKGGGAMEVAVVPVVDVAEGAPTAVGAARGLPRRYGEGDTAVDALRGVTLEVQQGQLTAVMGPSGSGKSTLMHILAALDRPTSGEIWIAGTKLGSLNDTEKIGRA